MGVCAEDSVLEELLQLLILEKIEENIFRGQSQDLGFGNVFGGQVLGQALSAAYETILPDRKAHSLHAYFLQMGDVTKPIVYEVDAIREGKRTERVLPPAAWWPYRKAAQYSIWRHRFKSTSPDSIIKTGRRRLAGRKV